MHPLKVDFDTTQTWSYLTVTFSSFGSMFFLLHRCFGFWKKRRDRPIKKIDWPCIEAASKVKTKQTRPCSTSGKYQMKKGSICIYQIHKYLSFHDFQTSLCFFDQSLDFFWVWNIFVFSESIFYSSCGIHPMTQRSLKKITFINKEFQRYLTLQNG